MNSFFEKLRIAECELIAEKFCIDLNGLIETLGIKKTGAEASKKALRVYLGETEEICAYLKDEYKKSRDANRDIELDSKTVKELIIRQNAIAAELEKRQNQLVSQFDELKINNQSIYVENEESGTSSQVQQGTQTVNRGMEAEKWQELINTVKLGNKLTGLKEFSGAKNEDVEEHLINFGKLARLREWNNASKLEQYGQYLKGVAYDFYVNEILKEDGTTTWDEVKDAMKNKFKKDEDDWLYVLEKSKQKENEDAE